MKLIIFAAVLICAVFVSAKYTPGHDGHPGCKTEQEVEQGVWRNNNDPTKYWLCSKLNSPATEASCELEYMFSPQELKCVHYTKWQWTAPVDPPSMA